MKADRVSNGQQTNLTFKGYTSNSLKEYIGAAVKKEVRDVVELANEPAQKYLRADKNFYFPVFESTREVCK